MTMSNNYQHEQPDELQQQQQSTLPLLYLPIELAEEISLYFDEQDAAKLLRVSRSFHNLFLPRVWVHLDTFTAIGDEQARQHMLEKYGHLVRSISFEDDIVNEFNFDWLPFVKRAVHIKTKIYNRFSAEEAEMLIKLIKQSNELRMLDLRFVTYGARVNFDELAAAINGLKYLERIKCEFGNDFGVWDKGSEWKRAIDLVDLLHPSARSKLRMRMNFDKFSDDVDVQALAPYIVKLVGFVNVACTKPFVHEFFGVCDNDGQLLAFPQLKELSMTSCCFDIEEYDVNSIKASRFPQLQSLYFRSKPCNSENIGRQSENEHETYNWKPEYSGYPHVIVSSQRWQCLTYLETGIISSSILMDIINLNPQIQRLTVGAEHSRVLKVNDASKYNHDVFHLDVILNRLPHLVEFSARRLNSRIVADPVAVLLKRRYEINIKIGCQMSVAPSAVVYILHIPRLTSLSFNECVLVDAEETAQLLQGSSAMCGVRWFNLSPLEWNHDLALAVTEKMPLLEWFTSRTCPREDIAIFNAKCQPRS